MKQLTTRFTVVTVLIFGACGTLTLPPSAAAGPVDHLFAGIGEFELGNGDKRTIANNKTDKVYRICVVRSGSHKLSVEVMFDDATETIDQGNCADVEGKHIVVRPTGKMEHGWVLAGRYHLIQPN